MHQSYKLLGEPFGLGKTSVATIIENHLPLFLRWSEQKYVQIKSIDELREISRRRIDSPIYQSVHFMMDTVPTRIPEMSGPLCRDFHNIHKKYRHSSMNMKTQAIVDLDVP